MPWLSDRQFPCLARPRLDQHSNAKLMQFCAFIVPVRMSQSVPALQSLRRTPLSLHMYQAMKNIRQVAILNLYEIGESQNECCFSKKNARSVGCFRSTFFRNPQFSFLLSPFRMIAWTHCFWILFSGLTDAVCRTWRRWRTQRWLL